MRETGEWGQEEKSELRLGEKRHKIEDEDEKITNRWTHTRTHADNTKEK